MKTVYILRAVPGAGKSTVAEHIHNMALNSGRKSIICCADDFFIDEAGNYKWVAEKIGSAHVWCQNKYHTALFSDVDNIIVANTNTRARDVNSYHKLALDFGYTVFVLTVENWHNGKDIHNVPDEAKLKMAEQLKNSIKL